MENPVAIQVLVSLVGVGFTGLVGLVIAWINGRVFRSVTNLDSKMSNALGELRLTQVDIKGKLEQHISNDELKHKDFERRIDRLED